MNICEKKLKLATLYIKKNHKHVQKYVKIKFRLDSD